MTKSLKKIEAFFMKEFSEKSGRIAVFALLLLIPNFTAKLLFLFLFTTTMLSSDINNKRFSTLITLPFSYKEIYIFSFVFMISIVTFVTLLGGLFIPGGFSYILTQLYKSLIFVTFYYSIGVLSVTYGLDNFGIPLLIFIADLILGGIGYNYFYNPYKAISPVYQGISWAALIFSVVIFFISFYEFNRKGVQK